ncbi:MAG: SMP-30/gluconolactonase/LRE family protein [Planctomycetota bacterium]
MNFETRPKRQSKRNQRHETDQNATRRSFMRSCAGVATACLATPMLSGCIQNAEGSYEPDLIWGRRGLSDGRFMKPRAMVMSPDDELFIVDKTGRIHVFDAKSEDVGKPLNDKNPLGAFIRTWRTPMIKQGRPTGLGWSNDGQLLVADTHYYRVLFYEPDGTRDETKSIGGVNGDEPGQFHFVTDVTQDARGHFFVGQYGQIDRIQEFDPEGNYIRRWGSQGSKPGEFARPQALLFDEDGLLWVADACNHRIQVFDVSGKEPELVKIWGELGRDVGKLKTPYGMDFDEDGTLIVAEFGNHRVQRFSRDGESLECWGSAGSGAGQFLDPWAVVFDSKRNIHVLDTGNNRVQRFRYS